MKAGFISADGLRPASWANIGFDEAAAEEEDVEVAAVDEAASEASAAIVAACEVELDDLNSNLHI